MSIDPVAAVLAVIAIALATTIGIKSLQQGKQTTPWKLERVSETRWKLTRTGRGIARIKFAGVHGEEQAQPAYLPSGDLSLETFTRGHSVVLDLSRPYPGHFLNVFWVRGVKPTKKTGVRLISDDAKVYLWGEVLS